MILEGLHCWCHGEVNTLLRKISSNQISTEGMNPSSDDWPSFHWMVCGLLWLPPRPFSGRSTSTYQQAFMSTSCRSGERRKVEGVNKEINGYSLRQRGGWAETKRQRSFCTSVRYKISVIGCHAFPTTLVKLFSIFCCILFLFWKVLLGPIKLISSLLMDHCTQCEKHGYYGTRA